LIKGQKLVILKRVIDKLLTIKEVTKILRVSERSVFRYIGLVGLKLPKLASRGNHILLGNVIEQALSELWNLKFIRKE